MWDKVKTIIAIIGITITALSGLWKAAGWVQHVNDTLSSLEKHQVYYHGEMPAADK